MNIEQTIAALSAEEKVALLTGAGPWRTVSVERLGIPSLTMVDGPHGVRLEVISEGNDALSTTFPVEAAMAASWNLELVQQAARAIAGECRRAGVDIILGPGVNGKRSPLGGRNFEYFSEDPLLSGEMAAAWIQGVQSQGIGACLKHFVANEQEKNRMETSSELDELSLREMYLKPFEIAISKANPWTLMCAYNRVNGTHMAEHQELLEKLLRDEWNYHGVVISDWSAVVRKVPSVDHGVDLEMPGPGWRDSEVLQAIERDELSMESIDVRVHRMLELIEKSQTSKDGTEKPDTQSQNSHALAVELATESMVLLKNEADILPLENGSKIAVIGRFAQHPRIQGGGSSNLHPSETTSPLDALQRYFDCSFKAGYQTQNTGAQKDLIEQALSWDNDTQAVIVFIGTTDDIESEGYDRNDLQLPDNQKELLRALENADIPVVAVNMSGSAVDLRPVDKAASAIIQAWLPGQGGSEAIARIVSGEANPSGKLSESFPMELEHNPAYLHVPGNIDVVQYAEGQFTGYRHYDAKKLPVQYPFGHGLSYTQFEYMEIEIFLNGGWQPWRSQVQSSADTGVLLRQKVRNSGATSGKTVVQLYVGKIASNQTRPLMELKAFRKLLLQPGQEKWAEFSLGRQELTCFSTELGRSEVEQGDYRLFIGQSSRDIRTQADFSIGDGAFFRRALSPRNDLFDFAADPQHGAEIQRILNDIRRESNDHPLFGLFLGMPARLTEGFFPTLAISQESEQRLLDALNVAMKE